LGGQIRDTTKNIGEDLREIGEDKKEDKLEEEELWRQLRKKKKKSSKRSQDLETGQKKITMRWETYGTCITSYKSSGRETLRGR